MRLVFRWYYAKTKRLIRIIKIQGVINQKDRLNWIDEESRKDIATNLRELRDKKRLTKLPLLTVVSQ